MNSLIFYFTSLIKTQRLKFVAFYVVKEVCVKVCVKVCTTSQTESVF